MGGVRLNYGRVCVREPIGKTEWDAYYDLRWRMLRAPWEQPKGSERDGLECEAIHRLARCDDGAIVACGRLHRLDRQRAQIRYMAVEAGQRGKGLGSDILRALEEAARDLGVSTIELHARENSLPFYRRHGYVLIRESHVLFGQIRHFLMQKKCLPKTPG
jgi:predicted GNAT family N-acyltransferase